jgi:hypothetical protein
MLARLRSKPALFFRDDLMRSLTQHHDDRRVLDRTVSALRTGHPEEAVQ